MFSGKSSYLEQLYNKYTRCNVPTVVINHSCDACRYTVSDSDSDSDDLPLNNKKETTYMVTHEQHRIPCTYVSSLFSVKNEVIESCTVFLINEGQFFAELATFVQELLEKKKTVVVCGLDGDFKRAKFGQMLDIIPLCDKVTKLTATCEMCKLANCPAIFTVRLDSKTRDQVLVGGAETYKPVCRACYVKNTVC
jgi:thymidine kinase